MNTTTQNTATLTTNQTTENTAMTTTTSTRIDTSNINSQQFISMLSAVLHSNGQSPMHSLIIATAMMTHLNELGEVSIEEWVEILTEMMADEAAVTVGDLVHKDFVIEGWFDTLVHAELMTRTGVVGYKLVEMILDCEKSYPARATMGVERRKAIMPRNTKHRLAAKSSNLMDQAVSALQATQYEVDVFMYDLLRDVAAYPEIDFNEWYMLDGCAELIAQGNVPRVSEFGADRRGRLYQSDVYGPNGQASDDARSVMNLSNVATTYNVAAALVATRDEMDDMVQCDLQEAIDHLRSAPSLAKWVVEQKMLKKHAAANTLPEALKHEYRVAKPASFIKANRILEALERGESPYIGMAYGLDAKCSGPQYGAIMTGDKTIAAACGFGLGEAGADAYHLAIVKCQEAGIDVTKLTRAVIKKPYMGIFYGQQAGAFSDLSNYGTKPNQNSPALLEVIQSISATAGDNETLMEAQARKFHKAVESSFGMMQNLRRNIKDAHSHRETNELGQSIQIMDTTGPTMHMMPDHTFVAMDYRVKQTVTGEQVGYGTVVDDVMVYVGGEEHKFEKMTFSTSEYDLAQYARTGFVNMIQATDALVARHIIVEAARLGADHIIGVHDCFRVNINDLLDGVLTQAIKTAYSNVFTNLTKSGDITAEYFRGVKAAGSDNRVSPSAYMLDTKCNLRMDRFGKKVSKIIDSLGEDGGSYYFAK